LKEALRPKARVAIIDNKKQKGIMSRLGHSSSKVKIVGEMKKAGQLCQKAD
jgi:hypothetical protein